MNISLNCRWGGEHDSEKKASQKSDFLTNLQALRAIAFCGVMLAHTGFNVTGPMGPWGVSIFFVLSGFVMVHSYYNKRRLKPCSIINNLLFACTKLKRLFLLHVLCTLAMTLFFFVGDDTKPVTFTFVARFVLNLFLLQEWVPYVFRSINGVSWFLCTILLGYFLFPWFLKLFEQNFSIKKAKIWILISIIVELGLGMFGQSFFPKQQIDGSILTYDITHWICYRFPLSRIWDMIIGLNLGYIFINSKRSIPPTIVSIAEFIGVIFSVASCYLVAPNRWWTCSLIFVFGSILLIYSFALQSGIFSNILTNKITLYLAKISPYGFLIHYVVFRYLTIILYRIPGFDKGEFEMLYGGWCKLLFGVAISLICSELWMKLYNRLIASQHFKFI